MDDTDEKRWLIGQIQYSLHAIYKSKEADKSELENRIEQYKSSLFGGRDKILAGVAFFATILLGLSSIYTAELRGSLLVLLVTDIIIGIIVYVTTEVIIYKGLFVFAKIKAAYYIPLLRLRVIDNVLIDYSFELNAISVSHLKNFLNYVKLVNMSNFELINQFQNASHLASLLQQKNYFNLLAQQGKRQENEACVFYKTKRDDFLPDEQIVSCDTSIARILGDIPLFQKYKR